MSQARFIQVIYTYYYLLTLAEFGEWSARTYAPAWLLLYFTSSCLHPCSDGLWDHRAWWCRTYKLIITDRSGYQLAGTLSALTYYIGTAAVMKAKRI